MVYEIERSLDFDVNKKLELYRKKIGRFNIMIRECSWSPMICAVNNKKDFCSK